MSKKKTVLSGDRFGRLTIIKEVKRKRKGKRMYRNFLCQCDCGTVRDFLFEYMNNGCTQSCGCYKKETTIKRSYRHGHSPRGLQNKTYISWSHMKQRCLNKKDLWHQKYYSDVSYDSRWEDYRLFLEDMGERPEGKSLDRIDPFGNYCKENCRWATPQEQMQNLRKSPRKGLDTVSI